MEPGELIIYPHHYNTGGILPALVNRLPVSIERYHPTGIPFELLIAPQWTEVWRVHRGSERLLERNPGFPPLRLLFLAS